MIITVREWKLSVQQWKLCYGGRGALSARQGAGGKDMVIELNKNWWIDISIVTVEVMLMKICYGRLNLVDDGLNCDQADAKSR